MRASAFTLLLLVLLAGSQLALAESEQSQPAVAIAAAELAQAARRESLQFQQVVENARSMPAASKAQSLDRKQAAGSARKSSRGKKLKEKLQEAERLRIRNEYREQQEQRISVRLRTDWDSTDSAAAEPSTANAAD